MAGNGNSWLRDALSGPEGERSSKRLFGAVMISAGVLILITLAVVGFFVLPPGVDAIKYAGLTLLGGGAGLLGVGTLFERVGGAK